MPRLHEQFQGLSLEVSQGAPTKAIAPPDEQSDESGEPTMWIYFSLGTKELWWVIHDMTVSISIYHSPTDREVRPV